VSCVSIRELRRKNLIGSFPYQTKTGWLYDSGDFAAAMGKCQMLADWPGYAERHTASAAAGRLRGRGIVYYTDNTGIFNERMELRFDPSGELTILAGTCRMVRDMRRATPRWFRTGSAYPQTRSISLRPIPMRSQSAAALTPRAA